MIQRSYIGLMILVLVGMVFADPPHTREGSFVGGYGEIIMTSQNGERSAQYRRFILYLGYAFNDKLAFRSELEYEHGTELALEQAYVEWKFSSRIALRSGLLLVPTSRVNLYHEPTYFFPNDRPAVDTYLIPSTWREVGLGLSGILAEGLQYDLYLIAGMNSQEFSATGFIRNGRQGAGKLEGGEEGNGNALFTSPAVTGRLTYVMPLRGLRMAASAYYGGVDNRPDGVKTGSTLSILSADMVWEYNGVYLSGTVAWDRLSNARAINEANGLSGVNGVGETAIGGNIVAGVNILYFLSPEFEIRLLPYYMFETVKLHYQVPVGSQVNPAANRTYHRFGVVLFPHDQVVFKANYTLFQSGATNQKWFQLGVGYNF